MRKKIVAGNWKMNNTLSEAEKLIEALKKQDLPVGVNVIVAPSFTMLHAASLAVKGSSLEVAAQNMHEAESGAYTGEVAAAMLKSVGVNTVILGHSERRTIFKEDHALIAKKVKTALQNKMTVIFCFGEELKDRKAGKQFEVVKTQLREGLVQISETDWKHIVLAYEPVWAIGTGETASPEQAQEMHAYIRTTIAQQYSKSVAEGVSILYGGSVKPDNASDIFGKPDVDGGLIGGASLNANSFMAIINSF